MPSEHPEHSAHYHAENFTSREKTLALVIVALAFVMDLLDNTIVNIAIPSIQANLGASYATIQWLVAGYALTFAILLITGGRMGDVFGYKRMFMIGVTGFTLASLLCGLAWNSEVLIIARLLQGSMSALMVPQVMSMMQILYKPEERGQVMGLFGALAGVAATLGPVIGGVLIHFNIFGLDWRPIFLINIPVGVFALIAGARVLPNGKSPHPLKLDLLGTGLVMVALFLLIFPLIQGRDLGWPAWTFWMMLSALPVLAVFTWWQFRKDKIDGSALIVPVLLKTRTFVMGLIVNITFESAMLGFFLPFTLILQIGLGYDVIKAALTGIPTAIGISVTMAVFSQKIIPRLGRYALTLGTVAMAIGLGLLYFMLQRRDLDMTPWEFIPGLLITGFGMAMIMTPIFAVVLTDVDHQHAGSASGVLSAVQQLGGAIGIALIGLFFFGQLSTGAPASFDKVAPSLRNDLSALHLPMPMQEQVIAGAKACYVDQSQSKDPSQTAPSCKKLQPTSAQQAEIPPALVAAQQKVGQTIMDQIKMANADNFIGAFKVAYWFELTVLAVVFLLSFALPRHIRPEAFQEGM